MFSVIKSNEQLLTDNQCNGHNYVDINHFVDPNFNANTCRHMVFELCVLSPPAAPGGLRHMVPLERYA